MIAANQSYDRVTEEDRLTAETPSATMIGRVVSDFFRQQEDARLARAEVAAWSGPYEEE
jgi:hypothetical protein